MFYACIFTCFFAFVVIYLFKYFFDKVSKLPPGPWGVPFLGYYPFLGSKPQSSIDKLADKYGEIMTLNYFGRNHYYLNSYDVIKQVLIKQTNFTCERPPLFSTTSPFGLGFGPKSLVNTSGNDWKSFHTFMLSKLSALGAGKTRMNEIIIGICDKLVNYITKTNGNPFDVYEYLTNFSSNVISAVLFSKSFEYDDPQYIRLRDDVREFFICAPGIDGNLSGTLFNFINWIKSDCWQRQKSMRKRGYDYFLPIIKERVNQRRNNRDFECNDLMDYYVERNLQNAEYFEMDSIAINSFMWFVAGTETTATTIYHAINLLILNPEIQENLQQEIDKVFGSHRQVSYLDRHLVPYTQAVLAEVQRIAAVIPFGIIRSNTKAITVTTSNGIYVIPEKSCIIANLWKCSRDPKHFKNAEKFDPNNFLNENGEFVNNEASLPFSAGKRLCIGSSISKMELFIAFVTLFQRFQWRSANDESVPRVIIETQARVLGNFNCCAVPRQ